MERGRIDLTSYDSLLFDVDGVLLDVRGVGLDRYLKMIEAALRAHGLPTDEATKDLFLGHEDIDSVRNRCATHDVSFPAFWRTKETAEAQLQVDCIEMGDIVSFDDSDILTEFTIPIAMVSNNQQRVLECSVATGLLPDVFTSIFGRNPTPKGIERMKPAPDLIKAAMSELDSTRPLLVGDSETDLTAAARADIDSAWLNRNNRTLPQSAPDQTYTISTLDALRQDTPV